MGLKDIMTKPWKLGSTELAWQEPHFYRIQLRADAHWRMLIALAIGPMVAGILLGLFSLHRSGPSNQSL